MDENHRKFESIQALIRQLHGESPTNFIRRQSNEEMGRNIQRSPSDRSLSSLNTLSNLEIEKPKRKRSVFEAAFRIPKLMITGPYSSPIESTQSCTLEESPHRRFSFGNFRRHSHSSVREHFSLIAYEFYNKLLDAFFWYFSKSNSRL